MAFQSPFLSMLTATMVSASLLPSPTRLQTTPTSTTIPGDSDGGGGGGGGGGDTLTKWSSLIGIVTAIVGNILIALALNVQRYAHTKLNKERARVKQRARLILKRAQSSNQAGSYGALSGTENWHSNGNRDANGDGDRYPGSESELLSASFQSGATTVPQDAPDASKVSSNYLKSPYWWLGQILITLGEMGNFLAYGFAPASIVSPLGVVALISNCIIAPAMFHEKFRQRDFFGVVIAVSGVVTVVLSAKQEETKLNPGDILDAITTMAFEIYLGVTIFLIAILMWASGRYGRRTSLIDLGLVGLFGGYTALATKGVSSMLSSTLWRAFTAPLTYLLLFILLGTAVMQIRYVNKALQRFDSTQVIPIQFVTFTLCVIIGSAVLYRDFEKTTPEQAAKFVGGCLLTFFGVFLITSGRQRKDDDEDLLDDADGIDETIGLMDQDGNPAVIPENNLASRRSSKASRVNFAEPSKDAYQDEREDSGTMHAKPILGASPRKSLEYIAGQGIGSPPHGGRSLSSNSVVSAPAPSSDIPPNATPTLRDPQLALPQTSARPVTPRANTTTPMVTTRDRDHTFFSPSPLYSTVTTVVKDALRENAGLNNLSSMRRIRSSIRASLFFDSDEDDEAGSENDTQQTAIAPPSDNDLLRIATSPEQQYETANESSRQRSRSLSETVGSFFRSKKKTRNNDIENGPGDNGSDAPSA